MTYLHGSGHGGSGGGGSAGGGVGMPRELADLSQYPQDDPLIQFMQATRADREREAADEAERQRNAGPYEDPEGHAGPSCR